MSASYIRQPTYKLAISLLTVLLMVPLLTTCEESFQCLDTWRSDGNYYNLDICMLRCHDGNIYQNVTNVQQLTLQCCGPICDSQIAYHTGKRTAIIVVVSVLLFLVFICCIFGCCGPSIKKRYVLHQEAKKRKVVDGGLTQEQFDVYANEFSGIFVEEERDNWEQYFVVEGQKFCMQWFTFSLKKTHNYEYKITITGQDVYGSFRIDGYYVSTDKGPTAWGVKNYQNIQNSSIYFQKHSQIVHDVIRMEGGEYEGVWYNRKLVGRSGECAIKKRGGPKIESQEVLDHFQVFIN